ncbi:MAG: hypothetical protein WBJ84_04120 [Bacteroidales bacterium]
MTLNKILTDNKSGSSEIATKVLQWLSEELNKNTEIHTDELNSAFEQILETFPHFAVLEHLTGTIREILPAIGKIQKYKERQKFFETFIKDYHRTWSDKILEAASVMVKTIDFSNKQIFLHSRSGSILSLFKKLKEENINTSVIQTVSAPAGEGILQAKYIAQLGFQVTLINEAASGRWMNKADMMITGADAIYPDHLINKTGTLPLALLCRHFQKPYYVLTDSRKICNIKTERSDIYQNFTETQKPSNEILTNVQEGIQPVNFYFEPVPIYLTDRIFIELS